MKNSLLNAGVLLVGVCIAASGAIAQTKTKIDIGKREYELSCANCHGISGKGDGALRPWLTRSPTDLTVMAKNNGGILPVPRIYEVIEGTAQVAGHGTADMPAWGNRYKTQAAEYYLDVPYDAEAFVRLKILSLVEYISRLQAK